MLKKTSEHISRVILLNNSSELLEIDKWWRWTRLCWGSLTFIEMKDMSFISRLNIWGGWSRILLISNEGDYPFIFTNLGIGICSPCFNVSGYDRKNDRFFEFLKLVGRSLELEVQLHVEMWNIDCGFESQHWLWFFFHASIRWWVRQLKTLLS